MKRTLSLRSEWLGELTDEDLRDLGAAGAAAPTVPLNTCVFCVTVGCITQPRTRCC